MTTAKRPTARVIVKQTPVVAWNYVGYCLHCHNPIGARGMAEVGAHFDYHLICQRCHAEHTLEVSVG